MKTIIFLFFTLIAFKSTAATYWAAPNGSNTGPCVSSSTDPGTAGYLSIGRAGECATVSPWIIMMKGNLGTYSGDVHTINTSIRHVNSFASGISPSTPNIIQGVPGEPRPFITTTGGWINFYITTSKRNNITFRNFKYDGQNKSEQAMMTSGSDLIVEDCEIGNTWGAGIFTRAHELVDARHRISRCKIHHAGVTRGSGYAVYGIPRDSIFEDNEIHDVSGAGLQIQYDHSNVIVRNNYFHNIINGFYGSNTNACTGMYVANYTDRNGITHAKGVQIYNNIFDLSSCPTTSQSAGIQVYETDGLLIANNIFYKPGQYGISFINYSQKSVNVVVSNNIIAGTPQKAIANIDAGGGLVSYVANNNACESTRDCGANGKVTIASITDCADPAANFRHKSGSLCVNKGTGIAAVTTDKDKVARPQDGIFDIGAYEFLSGSSTPAKPAPPSNLQVR
jgi:hypothetical protein